MTKNRKGDFIDTVCDSQGNYEDIRKCSALHGRDVFIGLAFFVVLGGT